MKKREITPLPEGFADLVASKSGYAPAAKPQSSLQLLENEMRVVNTQLTSARQGGAGNVRKLHEAKIKLAKEIEEAKASNKADQAVGDTKMPNVEANVKTPEGKADKETPKRKGDQAQADSMEKVKEDLDEGYNESACVGEMKKLHASACSKTEMYNKVSEKYGCSQSQFDELYAQYCNETYKEEKELDDVDPKAVKKKFANRKDKDLDNDGDTDSSDEYLHKRRKAISQALNEKPKKPNASVDESAELQGLDEANEELEEDAKMGKQSDENLKKLHKQFKAMNQQTPSTQHMMKRITKEMKRRKMTVEGLDEVLDTPDKMDRYRSKSKYASDRARNSATAKIVRGGKDISKEKETIRKREKGLDMADRNAGRKFRKSLRKEEVELDEAPRRKGAPKMTGDSIAIQRAKDAAHNKAMGRTKTGRKKPVRTMTSTQKSLASLRGEEVELDEAKNDYTISHKTFSSAVQHAVEVAKKRGYEVDSEDYDRKVAMGPRKPGKGKTNSYSIDVTKNGKPVKQKLQMQVYYDQGRYELNMYIQ